MATPPEPIEPTIVSPPVEARRVFSPAIIEQLFHIESAFGGRKKVIAILACAPKSPAVDYLLGLLTDAEASETIADLCVAANIRPSELLQHLSAGNVLYARTMAMAHLPEHLPRTVGDLLAVSHVYEGVCDTCWGEKAMPVRDKEGHPVEGRTETCPVCKGQGTRQYQPTPEARNKALEIGGMVEKGGGMTLNLGVQTHVQTGGGGGALEQVQAAAEEVLRRADAEYVPSHQRQKDER